MWPDFADTRELKSVLDVLGAMITPAVLILASSSLLITTSSRSVRCVDRVRERAEELQALGKGHDEGTNKRREHLFKQLEINTRRARLLQKAMGRLYLGISFFIATSVSIGVVSLLHVDLGFVPMVLGFVGAFLLFSASVYLIFESRLALATTFEEMDYIDRNYMRQE
ncbi:MAG TPA: DUF2721 domain-containing protein [Thermoanaerobaculia bacterium]|nr:DUF2721 domain-containing protein [Thermoanaerobaculia bacterium]